MCVFNMKWLIRPVLHTNHFFFFRFLNAVVIIFRCAKENSELGFLQRESPKIMFAVPPRPSIINIFKHISAKYKTKTEKEEKTKFNKMQINYYVIVVCRIHKNRFSNVLPAKRWCCACICEAVGWKFYIHYTIVQTEKRELMQHIEEKKNSETSRDSPFWLYARNWSRCVVVFFLPCYFRILIWSFVDDHQF